MRIAVISDIHANAIALKAVLKHIRTQEIDKIIFLGDLVMNGPHPNETMEIIKELSPLIWIKGNTDNWFCEIESNFISGTEKEKYIYFRSQYANNHLNKEDIDLLLSKPVKQNIEIEGISILCVHGSPRSISEPLGLMSTIETIEQVTNEISENVLLCGHTHLPYYVSLNGKKIISVGSVSLSMDGESLSSYGILDIHKSVISYTNHKVPYDIEQVINDATKEKLPYIDRYKELLTFAK